MRCIIFCCNCCNSSLIRLCKFSFLYFLAMSSDESSHSLCIFYLKHFSPPLFPNRPLISWNWHQFNWDGTLPSSSLGSDWGGQLSPSGLYCTLLEGTLWLETFFGSLIFGRSLGLAVDLDLFGLILAKVVYVDYWFVQFVWGIFSWFFLHHTPVITLSVFPCSLLC